MSTKIINVLKSDTFEEVFELFKTADAEEIILIFPKGSRFTKQRQYFEAIGLEAERSGKRVSVMSADPAIVRFAAENEIEIIAPPSTKKNAGDTPIIANLHPRQELASKQTQILKKNEDDGENDWNSKQFQEDLNEQPEAETALSYDDEFAAGDEGEVILTGAGTNIFDRRAIKDIVPAEYEKNLKVKSAREKAIPVETKNQPIKTAEEVRKITEKRGIFEQGILSQKFSQKTGDIGRIWAEREQSYRLSEKSRPKETNGNKMLRRFPLLLTGGAFVILFLILYLTLGSAKITLHPQKQELNFKLKISASVSESSVNAELNRIPGQKFFEQKEKSGIFPATGQKEVAQKASGKITIFNMSTSEQRLVATTRFRSPEGLIFRIPQTLTVPAGKKTGTEVMAGSIESVVYADRPGTEYNIGPTRFTIPGFEGSQKFNDFYATSTKPMSGGLIGPAKVITEEDFNKAQKSIEEELKTEIMASILGQAANLKVIDSAGINIEPPMTNAKVGEAAENLQITLRGSVETIAFKESDVIEVIKNYVKKSGDAELISEGLKLEYFNPELSSDKKSMTFSVTVNGLAVAKFDKEKILKDVMGMSEDAIRTYFTNIKEIESAKIILSPFWVKSIPKDANRIKLNIEI